MLAFMPMIAKASILVSRFSKTGADIINTNINGEDGDWGYVNTFHDAIQPAVLPGRGLDATNRMMLGLVASQFDEQAKFQKQKVNLSRWVQHQITLATTNSIYGSGNPFKDSGIEQAFW
jgi:hypothetical protein